MLKRPETPPLHACHSVETDKENRSLCKEVEAGPMLRPGHVSRGVNFLAFASATHAVASLR